ncbi:hypothetical protein SORBI_3002G125100 [Sorghum bicolor]|nr:hypothetical protein SORBI_3002G125100 [Sorghum bicolor]
MPLGSEGNPRHLALDQCRILLQSTVPIIMWINEMVITRIHKARSTHRPAAATNLHPRLSGTRKEGCWLAFQRDPVIFYNLLHRSL